MHAQPLQGRRIVVTRAEDQAAGLIERLRELGAEPIACPVIAIAPPADFAPLDNALARLSDYTWLIVTSVNGVRMLTGRIAQLGQDVALLKRLKIGAIGPATAHELAKHGLEARFVPTTYVAESILAEIGHMAGQRVLLPRADIARETLAAGLREKGAIVDEIAAYRTVPGTGAQDLIGLLRAQMIDAITFTSSSTVRYLIQGLTAAGVPHAEIRALLTSTVIACIGPVTAATVRAEGLHVDVVADTYTTEGLVAALVDWFQEPRELVKR